MNNTNRATYEPESNKLRLYVGRVPREEYVKLRAEGWTALHKQREAGGGDFAATWTPQRRNTALEYAGIIEDEDMSSSERAADRAERFGEYRHKRTTEATGRADAYDAGPQVHGYQSQARAERAASRHDRIADRACDAWSKAEYWQRRTTGVISHALHKSTPGVRMGRIKELEALLRKHEKDVEKQRARWELWQGIAKVTDPAKQTKQALLLAGTDSGCWSEYMHPRADELPDDSRRKTNATSLYGLLSDEKHPITGAEACALFFAHHREPAADDSWSLHYRLRLGYEQQMLEAQGGRLEQCEVLPGGKLGCKLILKVNKSQATGRATSVSILGPRVSGWTYKACNLPGTEWAEYQFDLERVAPGAYTPPTAESLAELEEIKAKIKAAAPKTETCPLINPTEADAQRLQDILNERAVAKLDEYDRKKFEPKQVCKITQAKYSANSKGTFARAETRELCAEGNLMPPESNMWSKSREDYIKRIGKPLCKIRITGYSPPAVIVITDKPQKPLPAGVWTAKEQPKPAAAPVPKLRAMETVGELFQGADQPFNLAGDKVAA